MTSESFPDSTSKVARPFSRKRRSDAQEWFERHQTATLHSSSLPAKTWVRSTGSMDGRGIDEKHRCLKFESVHFCAGLKIGCFVTSIFDIHSDDEKHRCLRFKGNQLCPGTKIGYFVASKQGSICGKRFYSARNIRGIRSGCISRTPMQRRQSSTGLRGHDGQILKRFDCCHTREADVEVAPPRFRVGNMHLPSIEESRRRMAKWRGKEERVVSHMTSPSMDADSVRGDVHSAAPLVLSILLALFFGSWIIMSAARGNLQIFLIRLKLNMTDIFRRLELVGMEARTFREAHNVFASAQRPGDTGTTSTGANGRRRPRGNSIDNGTISSEVSNRMNVVTNVLRATFEKGAYSSKNAPMLDTRVLMRYRHALHGLALILRYHASQIMSYILLRISLTASEMSKKEMLLQEQFEQDTTQLPYSPKNSDLQEQVSKLDSVRIAIRKWISKLKRNLSGVESDLSDTESSGATLSMEVYDTSFFLNELDEIQRRAFDRLDGKMEEQNAQTMFAEGQLSVVSFLKMDGPEVAEKYEKLTPDQRANTLKHLLDELFQTQSAFASIVDEPRKAASWSESDTNRPSWGGASPEEENEDKSPQEEKKDEVIRNFREKMISDAVQKELDELFSADEPDEEVESWYKQESAMARRTREKWIQKAERRKVMEKVRNLRARRQENIRQQKQQRAKQESSSTTPASPAGIKTADTETASEEIELLKEELRLMDGGERLRWLQTNTYNLFRSGLGEKILGRIAITAVFSYVIVNVVLKNDVAQEWLQLQPWVQRLFRVLFF